LAFLLSQVPRPLAGDRSGSAKFFAYYAINLPGLGLFEIGKVGLPYVLIGLLYIFAVGRRLLPDRKELPEQLGESRREFLVEMQVQSNCRMIGQSIESAGLRHLPALFLIEIDRDDKLIAPSIRKN
jgi:hypothetical protein